MDAPKRIWAWVDDLAGIVGQSDEPETPPNLPAGPNAISPCAEYILATEHARIVAEKDARIAGLERLVEIGAVKCEQCGDPATTLDGYGDASCEACHDTGDDNG